MLPLGVGINALPHSMRELAALGLLPRLDAIGIRTRTLTYANHLGQAIWSEPRGLHAGHDAPQFSLHRGRLQAMLWDAAAERLGACRAACRDGACSAYTQTGAGVAPASRPPDGEIEEVEGDALVGADGIHSALRGGAAPGGWRHTLERDHHVARSGGLAGLRRRRRHGHRRGRRRQAGAVPDRAGRRRPAPG